MDGLDWQTRHTFGQFAVLAEQSQANLFDVHGRQFAWVMRKVPGNQLILVGGMHRQRPHDGQATALSREHARNVQKRLGVLRIGGQAQFHRHSIFFVQPETEVKQAGLPVANQACHGNGGSHIAQGIVCRLMHQAVGGAKVGQLEAGFALCIGRPHNAIRPQRVSRADNVQQVPAPAVVLPLARIGVNQIAPEHEARDLIVKADGVVTHANGAGLTQRLLDLRGKLILGDAFFKTQLGRDAGDQARHRVGQKIIGWLAIQHDRLTHFIQVCIGSDRRKLRRPVTPHVGAKGFVVVPEEGVAG